MKSSTGDIIDYKYTGMLKPFGVQAHYIKDGTANILSFQMLAAMKDANMTYDRRIADCFRLSYNNGKEHQVSVATVCTHLWTQHVVRFSGTLNLMTRKEK